ncbi:unnamed protein product [Calypogeia fissa]
MVTAISPRCSVLLLLDNAQPEFGLSCNFSRSGSCSKNTPALSFNKSSKRLDDVVGVSRSRDCHVSSSRTYMNGVPCIVRAVLAESASQVIDNGRTKRGDPITSSSAGTTSLPATEQEMGLVDTSLESTLEHRLWFGFGASAAVGMVAKAVLAAHSFTDRAGICLGTIAAYILADLGTGIYHWGIDNYGDAETPIFGSQIDAFQGHHKRPWTITKREFANNLEAIARPVGFVLLPFLVLPSNPTGDAFLGIFLGLVVMSQQFHAWAHCKKSQLPAVVNFLQGKGILISRKMHGAHHKAPYSINYCIVSGLWNPILRESKFFGWLETAIYARWGVAPRCWTETVAAEWLQEGSYFEDGSDVKCEA